MVSSFVLAMEPSLMILNDKKQPVSDHAFLQVPNKDKTLLSVREFKTTFPRVAVYFNGLTVDRCLQTFYSKAAEKHEGKPLWQLTTQDDVEEVWDIFQECGYELDHDDDDDATAAAAALTDKQMILHREDLAQIREGLASLNGQATSEMKK
jgi:hypothetical protein